MQRIYSERTRSSFSPLRGRVCFFQSRFVTRPSIRASSAKAVYITFIHVDKSRGVEKASMIWRKLIGLSLPAGALDSGFWEGGRRPSFHDQVGDGQRVRAWIRIDYLGKLCKRREGPS